MPRRRRTLNPALITGLVIAGAVVLAWAGSGSSWLKTQAMSEQTNIVMMPPVPTSVPVPTQDIEMMRRIMQTPTPTPTLFVAASMPPTPTPTRPAMPTLTFTPPSAPTATFAQAPNPTMPPVTPTLTPPPCPGKLSFFSRLMRAATGQPSPCPGIGGSPTATPTKQPSTAPTLIVSPTPKNCPPKMSFLSRLLRAQIPCDFQDIIINQQHIQQPPVAQQQQPPVAQQQPPVAQQQPPRNGPWYCVNKQLRSKRPVIGGYVEGGMLKNFRIYSSLYGTVPVINNPPVGRPFCTEHQICRVNYTVKYDAADGKTRYQIDCSNAEAGNFINPPFLAARFDVFNGAYPWEYGHLFPNTKLEGYETYEKCQESCVIASDQMVEDIYNKLYADTVAPLWNLWHPWPWFLARSQLWSFAHTLIKESKAELLRPW